MLTIRNSLCFALIASCAFLVKAQTPSPSPDPEDPLLDWVGHYTVSTAPTCAGSDPNVCGTRCTASFNITQNDAERVTVSGFPVIPGCNCPTTLRAQFPPTSSCQNPGCTTSITAHGTDTASNIQGTHTHQSLAFLFTVTTPDWITCTANYLKA